MSSLLAAIEGELTAAHLVDLAALMRTASSALRSNEVSFVNAPVLLLDVSMHSKAEYQLVQALVSRAPEVLVTLPAEDEKSVAAVQMLPGAAEHTERSATEQSGLGWVGSGSSPFQFSLFVARQTRIIALHGSMGRERHHRVAG